jgi:hypothetical protein
VRAFLSRIGSSRDKVQNYALLLIGCLCLVVGWWTIDRFFTAKPSAARNIQKIVPSPPDIAPQVHDAETTTEKTVTDKPGIVEPSPAKKTDIADQKPASVPPPPPVINCTEALQKLRKKQDQANQLYEEEKYDAAERIYRQVVRSKAGGCNSAELRQIRDVARARINKIKIWKSN